eukprot:COSAG06_NODE_23292_length_696_cov_5.547739_1_plen_78_part_10
MKSAEHRQESSSTKWNVERRHGTKSCERLVLHIGSGCVWVRAGGGGGGGRRGRKGNTPGGPPPPWGGPVGQGAAGGSS